MPQRERPLRRWTPARLLAIVVFVFSPASASLADDEQPVDFAKQVRPLLTRYCAKCHGPEKQESGYRLDLRKHAFDPGESGEDPIVPGKPEDSPLVHLVRGDNPELSMPPEGERLNAAQVKLLIRWIAEGARWPEDAEE